MNDTPHPSASGWFARHRRAVVVLAGIAALALLAALVWSRRADDVEVLTVKVQRGDIQDAVEATGTVNAVITVQVGSQVSGTIARLDADFNSHVKKGDVIAVIDPRLFQGAVLQATADLQNSRANVVAAQANLAKARTALVQTKADYDRAQALLAESVGTAQALDQAKANYEAAKASVDAAAANILQAQAQVHQKSAALEVAKTNLEYTTIRSPIDGVVVARNVDVGQTVAASLQAPTVFTIAQDLTKMRVYVKVDESDVGRIRDRQDVTFKVDAFPRQVFHGVVSQVRMNPTTVQNVVTYDAVIEFDNPRLELFPGMTAYVTVPVAKVEHVLEVANAALRFKPALTVEAVRALYAKLGIAIHAAPPTDEGQTGPSAQSKATADETAVVWKKLPQGDIEPVQIALGITDHSVTEIRAVLVGTLDAGDEVATASVGGKSNPAPGGPRR